LIELTPTHPNWQKVKDAITSEAFTIDQVKSKYQLSNENELLLCSK